MPIILASEAAAVGFLSSELANETQHMGKLWVWLRGPALVNQVEEQSRKVPVTNFRPLPTYLHRFSCTHLHTYLHPHTYKHAHATIPHTHIHGKWRKRGLSYVWCMHMTKSKERWTPTGCQALCISFPKSSHATVRVCCVLSCALTCSMHHLCNDCVTFPLL